MPQLLMTQQKNVAVSTQSVVQHYYRSLRPGHQLRALQPNGQSVPVHLQQGELDGACGQYCLLMALTILGVAPRRGWENLSQRKSGTFAELWRMLSERFFSGSNAADVIDCIEQTPDEITYVVFKDRDSAIVDFCVEQLCGDAVVLLGTEKERCAHGHWTLVIGWEGYREHRATTKPRVSKPRVARALLCIDPSHREPVLTAYNVRLNVEQFSSRALTVETVANDDSVDRVTLDSAIAMRRTPLPTSRANKERVK